MHNEEHLAGIGGMEDLEALLEGWDGLDPSDRREGVRREIRRITIEPMGKKRPTAAESQQRVKIEWFRN